MEVEDLAGCCDVLVGKFETSKVFDLPIDGIRDSDFSFQFLDLADGLFGFRCSSQEILLESVLKLGAGRLSFSDLGR